MDGGKKGRLRSSESERILTGLLPSTPLRGLKRWVPPTIYRAVESLIKNYDVGFATASEVARNKEGDCTEHAVLLAALGRVFSIHTRVATGLVYADEFEGEKNVLVYHMWTQFYIDGKWVDLDPALGLVKCKADRITFSVDSMEDDLMASMIPVMELINNLKVTLQPVE